MWILRNIIYKQLVTCARVSFSGGWSIRERDKLTLLCEIMIRQGSIVFYLYYKFILCLTLSLLQWPVKITYILLSAYLT